VLVAGSQTGKETRVPEGLSAGEYAREAAAQWGRAFTLAAARWRSRSKGGVRSLLASSDGKGGRIGDLADAGISRMGKVGKLASKARVGSRIVERMRPDEPDDIEEEPAAGADGTPADGETGSTTPIPIQESIRVAVPVAVAYRLATTVQDYPAFVDRVKSAEAGEDDELELVVTARGSERRLVLRIENVRPNERIDWRCAEELPHLGTVTFHELAPRLTHIEVSIDREPSGLVERLTRRTHLSDRALHADLQRFKAYAELWEDPDEGTGEEDEELGGEALEGQEPEEEGSDEAEAEPEPAEVA
jgi:uncharacterized membrane protein